MQIRSKALVQYTTPFTSVNLSTMAQAFNTDIRCVLQTGFIQVTCVAPRLSHSLFGNTLSPLPVVLLCIL